MWSNDLRSFKRCSMYKYIIYNIHIHTWECIHIININIYLFIYITDAYIWYEVQEPFITPTDVIYTCVCVCVCLLLIHISTYIYICMLIYIYICMLIYIYIYIYWRQSGKIYSSLHTDLCMHVCMYACTYVCVCVCVCVCVYIYKQ